MDKAHLLSSATKDNLKDTLWRLNHLYWITDKEGERVLFKLNAAQEQFVRDMWFLNVILKARQLGMTTLINIIILDRCMWTSNIHAAIIAHTLHDAQTIFRDKIKYGYDQLPEALKKANPAVNSSANVLTFANGSSIQVATSTRSTTLQMLHVSEYGKICARYPEKAKEIRTGALNSVAAGQMVFIESTAEGRNEYYELCRRTQAFQASGKELSELDYKFHFYPWFCDPSYTLDYAGLRFGDDLIDYFAKLATLGIHLTEGQKNWYAKKFVDQQDNMFREYPSTWEEAFQAAIEGAYYAREITQLYTDGRMTNVPHDPAYQVCTAWDLGVDDQTCIWFFQHIGLETRFIDYYENSSESAAHYADYLHKKSYSYERHYLPHDAGHRTFQTGDTVVDTLKSLNIKPITKVPVTRKLLDDIQKCRNELPKCRFDETKCAIGISHLSSYCRERNADGTWKDRPKHDAASHGADAFRCFAIGFGRDERRQRRLERNPFRQTMTDDGSGRHLR